MALASVVFQTDDFAHALQDIVGLVGELLDGFGGGNAGEHQNGVQFTFDTGDDVGVHPVAHNGNIAGRAAQGFQGVAHHQRIGLADEVGLFAGGHFDGGDQGAAGGTAYCAAALYNKYFLKLEEQILEIQGKNAEKQPVEEPEEDERIFHDQLDESLVDRKN